MVLHDWHGRYADVGFVSPKLYIYTADSTPSNRLISEPAMRLAKDAGGQCMRSKPSLLWHMAIRTVSAMMIAT